MKTLYVSSGGGLGDTIYNFFIKEDWRSIRYIKENYPNSEIIAIFHSHCKEASHIATFNPYIDSILSYRWYNRDNPQKFHWQQLLNNNIISVKDFIKTNKVKQLDNEIYLSTSEQYQLNKLITEPYIAIAPFAGSSDRTILSINDPKRHCLPQETLLELINIISKDTKVIIIGQSSTINDHHDNPNSGLLLSSNNPNIINLTNKTPIRVTIKLAQSAKAFIGTHSSLLVSAWTKDIPSIYFYPTMEEKGINKTIINNGGAAGTFKMNLPIHFGYEKSAKAFGKLPAQEIYKKLQKVISCKN